MSSETDAATLAATGTCVRGKSPARTDASLAEKMATIIGRNISEKRGILADDALYLGNVVCRVVRHVTRNDAN